MYNWISLLKSIVDIYNTAEKEKQETKYGLSEFIITDYWSTIMSIHY